MPYNRKIFFDHVRESLFDGTLTQQQVDGQNVILFVAEVFRPDGDQRFLAYELATAYHETAQTMWPIEEYGQGKGRDYGETDPETGQAYYGRGLVQLTWRDNYAKATTELNLDGDRDLVWHADRALDSLIATKVMFLGMEQGWFTSRKLADYFNDAEDDAVNARQIINGNDQDDVIAAYHDKFLSALKDSWTDTRPQAVPTFTVTLDSDQPVKADIRFGHNVLIG